MLKNYFKQFNFYIDCGIGVFVVLKKSCIKAYKNGWEIDPTEVMSSFSSTPLR